MKLRDFIVLAVSLLCLVAGCGSGSERAISFSVGGAPAELDFWEELVAQFSRQTGIRVDLMRQPADSDQRRQGLVIPLAARKGEPDVFLMDVVWIAQFAASHWLERLDGRSYDERFDRSVFFPNIVELADTYEGAIIALPVYVDAGLLYYRTDLLERLDAPEPPMTWDNLVDLAEAGQRLVRPDRPGFSGFVWQGAQYEGLICTFLEFAGSGGGGIRVAQDKIFVDTPENRKAAQFMRDLIHRYRISPLSTYTEMREEEVRAAFQRGDALFERNWPYAWPLHQDADSPVRGTTGIALLPHFQGGKSIATLGGWHVGISAFSQNKPMGWEFVKFLLSYPVQKELALRLGWNPGRRDLYRDSEVLARMPHLTRLQHVFETAVPRPTIPYYAQLSEILQRHLNAVLADKATPQNALEAAQAEAQRLAQRYGQH